MPSYFDRFGPVPLFSAHAWRRLLQRGVTADAPNHALATDAERGITPETVVYRDERTTAVVNAKTGVIVTVWWTE